MKQIRNGELVGKIIDQGDGYFHWLQKVSGLSGPLSSMLAETEFVSKDGIDDVLVRKTKEEVRYKYAEDISKKNNLSHKETEILLKSIRGECCLFEVLICLSYSINEMFEDLDAYDGCEHFFGILMKNVGFDLFDEEDLDTIGEQVREYWQHCIDRVIDRTYAANGTAGGLFPLADGEESSTDRRTVSLWQQLNDWVDQHTNEDGEWVD